MRSSDGDRVQHLEAEVASLGDALKHLRHEFDEARSEYIRHMAEDCGALAAEVGHIKEAWAQFTTALQRADQYELKKLTQRITDLMADADGQES